MTTFAGLPVKGEKTPGARNVKQHPLEEFTPLVEALVSDPYIESFGWTQYTPYFNDGEPCVFSANGVWVQTVDDKFTKGEYGEFLDEDGDEMDSYEVYENLDVSYGEHPSLGKMEYHWEGTWAEDNRRRIDDGYTPGKTGDHEATLRAARELSGAVESGKFDNVLVEAFGDHATVRVSKAGIEIDSYEHD